MHSRYFLSTPISNPSSDQDQCIGAIVGTKLVLLISPIDFLSLSDIDKHSINTCKSTSQLPSLHCDLNYCTMDSSDLLYIPQNWAYACYNSTPNVCIGSFRTRSANASLQAKNPLEPLTEDIFAHILRYLPFHELPKVCQVSKYFNRIASHDNLWRFHFDRKLFFRAFFEKDLQKLETLSWKSKYKALLEIVTSMYKLPVHEIVEFATYSGLIQNDPLSIATLLLRGHTFGIDRHELGNYFTR
jgi:hypothetical protein